MIRFRRASVNSVTLYLAPIHWEVRIAAIENLTDQTLLARIAVEDPYIPVRLIAQDRLEALRP